MRRGFDGLAAHAALAQTPFQTEPFSGQILVFRGLARRPDQGAVAEWRRSRAGGERAEAIDNMMRVPKLNDADSEACLRHVIGYLPIGRQGGNLYFQLISRRYERGPMILTSNQNFCVWSEVFGTRVISATILDRLLPQAVTLNTSGNSYRLKEKLKAGLVRPQGTEA